MLKSTNKVQTNQVELVITIDAVSFEKAVQTAFKKNAGKMNVAGFRKGKAPRALIEKIYGENVFYEEALNMLYPKAYEEAVEQSGIHPVSTADINLVSMGKEGAEFTALVFVKPEVTIEGYKGLEVERPAVAVKDEEIEKELNKAAEKGSRIKSVERAAKTDDMAVIDFEGFVDGVAFQGGKAENHTLTIGSGQFIPGFEEQVAGHSAGEEFDVNVAFPADYHAEELAGKAAIFKVKLHEVKEKELPAIDDEFAKEVSEFDTLDQYKASIKEKIEQFKKSQADDSVQRTISEKLAELVVAEVPDCMFEEQQDHLAKDTEYRIRSQGMSLEQYLQYFNMTHDDYRANFRAQAEQQARTRLGLEKIAELEKITVSDEEIEAEYAKLSEAYKYSVEEIKGMIQPDALAKDVMVNKAAELVKDAAKIIEAAETDAKPAKKAAAKTKKAETAEEEAPAKKPAAKAKKAAKTEE